MLSEVRINKFLNDKNNFVSSAAIEDSKGWHVHNINSEDNVINKNSIKFLVFRAAKEREDLPVPSFSYELENYYYYCYELKDTITYNAAINYAGRFKENYKNVNFFPPTAPVPLPKKFISKNNVLTNPEEDPNFSLTGSKFLYDDELFKKFCSKLSNDEKHPNFIPKEVDNTKANKFFTYTLSGIEPYKLFSNIWNIVRNNHINCFSKEDVVANSYLLAWYYVGKDDWNDQLRMQAGDDFCKNVSVKYMNFETMFSLNLRSLNLINEQKYILRGDYYLRDKKKSSDLAPYPSSSKAKFDSELRLYNRDFNITEDAFENSDYKVKNCKSAIELWYEWIYMNQYTNISDVRVPIFSPIINKDQEYFYKFGRRYRYSNPNEAVLDDFNKRLANADLEGTDIKFSGFDSDEDRKRIVAADELLSAHPNTKKMWMLMKNVLIEPDNFVSSIRWLAHLLQKPNDLPGVALIIAGGSGTGKTLLSKLFCKIMTPPADSDLPFVADWINARDPNDEESRFKQFPLYGLCVFDELARINLRLTNQMKTYITGSGYSGKVMIEKKGEDAYPARTCTHYILLSNNSNIETDTPRRYISNKVRYEGLSKLLAKLKMSNRKFFTEVHDDLGLIIGKEQEKTLALHIFSTVFGKCLPAEIQIDLSLNESLVSSQIKPSDDVDKFTYDMITNKTIPGGVDSSQKISVPIEADEVRKRITETYAKDRIQKVGNPILELIKRLTGDPKANMGSITRPKNEITSNLENGDLFGVSLYRSKDSDGENKNMIMFDSPINIARSYLKSKGVMDENMIKQKLKDDFLFDEDEVDKNTKPAPKSVELLPDKQIDEINKKVEEDPDDIPF